ncbi:MAG: hypothetical protein M4579_006576 [Chaenotheca gracillima]|nr:MAG: hypothetical protein M4579_006576 [Chaenotheca gracillima]
MIRSHLSKLVDDFRPDLEPYEKLYRSLHQSPELSLQEGETAAIAAKHLEALSGFEVHKNIGGQGLVGILKNGSGMTVLVRADMDALPVQEQTGLPYSSTKTMKDVADGVTKPVMHACGHDVHVSCMLAAAETLHRAQKNWNGTLIVLFQPNEERAGGAQAMVDDGLYDRIPVPDVVLGQHVMPYRAGSLGTRPGPMMAAADSFKITLYGRGGHASQPHRTIDPAVMAAHVVVRLQGIASREVDPADTVVVTVGSIQAGMTENIISDHAILRINVRTFKPETRERVLASIRRIIKAESDASNAPKDPLIESTTRFPLTINDENVVGELEQPFSDHFGDRYTRRVDRLPGSEDFSILATSKNVPYCFWVFGGTDPEKWDKAEKEGRLLEDIPVNHSPFFAPVIQPTLKTGVDAMSLAVLSFLG